MAEFEKPYVCVVEIGRTNTIATSNQDNSKSETTDTKGGDNSGNFLDALYGNQK